MSSTNPNTPNSDEDLWYHGNIDKEEATSLLLQDGKEGTFLVRASSIGDYALSVYYMDEVCHFQILRHGNDAFFSIASEKHIIHGLDELIKFYQSPDSDYILLGRPLLNSTPPPECRRHGRTNLLHRATKEGVEVIVREMVSCGHRNLDAKNEEGKTAAHISSQHGHDDILKTLIEAGAGINVKDADSHTPLHYACIHNHPDVVYTLMVLGKANPQLRRSSDGFVPLHIAASMGHTDCVKALLDGNAPLRPRTNNEKLPIDLAIENGHEDTANYLRNFRRRPQTNRDDWYHSLLDRQAAANLLQRCQLAHNNDSKKCYFLIRRSHRPNQHAKVYVLTYQFQGRPSHFEIEQKDNFFYIGDGPYLESLEEIVDHYSRWADGLHSPLQIPACPTQSFGNHEHTPITSPSDSIRPPPLPKRTPLPSPNGLRLHSLHSPDIGILQLSPSVNNNISGFPKDNIPSDLIELGSLLGEGEFGDVFQGTFSSLDGTTMRVAVKTLKDEITETSKKELLREGRIMMNLEHDNIVKFIGICWRPKIYMVQELMELGSLHTYLRQHRADVNPLVNIPLWAVQVTKGMIYLEEKEVVHRDLAVRNILLSDVDTAKISDFGLSRVLGQGKDYYTAAHGGRWPIKWYALECCYHGTFSHKSDVWSFGITLWEMYTYGGDPYGGVPGNQVIEMVDDGYRLEKPDDCPENVYAMIRKCWEKEPDDRPTFSELNKFFSEGHLQRLETPC